MAALPPTPAGLRAIEQYIKLGQSVEGKIPVLSYWCRTHALKMACDKLATATDEEKSFIGTLMGGLEQDKVQLSSASFNPDDTATGFKLSKNLGFKYFKKADDDDRAGMASMGTAGMFRKASQLFTVALGLQQDAQVDEWTKYSKFKAVYISKEIKAGRVPEAPDGGGAAAPFDMPGPSAVDPYGGVPSMTPSGGGFDSGGYGAPPAMAPVSGVPSMAPIGGGDGYNPYGAPMQPMQPMQPVQPVQPVQPISMPTLPPSDSAYPSTATTGNFTAPGTINSLPPVAAPVYVPPTPTTSHTRTSAPARTSTTNSGLYNPKQTLTASEMGLAKKHCNFALSALQYNDPQTVVDNLLQALGHLSH